ncbi:antibiotic biosynthesis monooxygenase family protein [Heyndrickxia sporothermodurans]
MNFYITTGTYDFLERILSKYNKETMILMQNAQNSLLVHETPKKSVFGSPRKYEIIAEKGELINKGYASFYNIPISDEEKPVFEYSFQQHKKNVVETAPGIIAYRLLRPKKGDTYIIFTLWQDEKYYNNWKKTNAYTTLLSNKVSSSPLSSNTLFNGAPYETEYVISNDNEENASQ